ncbi:MAG: type II toxin-antitoxin system HicB family antitoxin [Leptospirales bacterium]|nr:type II toxin-antitoxin system HicB family antitoxin [Leptospirales bacterium]
MVYHFKTRRSKDGFWAECIELEGCRTQANSREVLERNAKEALDLYLNEADDSRILFAAPRRRLAGRNIFAVAVDPKIAFAQALRQTRIRRGLSQKQAARMLGMKNLYSYQRLESPRKANPALLTLARVKEVFPEISLDHVV